MAADRPGTGWRETLQGGSPEAEAAQFDRLAREMGGAHAVATRRARERGVRTLPARALHAKATLALDTAELRFVDDLATDLRHGHSRPGATYPAVVRFSNAANVAASDLEADLRGVAVRILLDDGGSHDLLMTNYPVSYARDGHQFVALAAATADEGVSRIAGLARVARRFGVRETVRMVRNVTAGRGHQPGSVFTETYWSRGATTWGPEVAVRYLLAPEAGTAEPAPSSTDSDYLTREAVGRLRAGPVRMELFVQRYSDPETTPIEDTSVEWSEQAAPRERVAILTLPAGDVGTDEAPDRAARIEALAFDPWNAPDGFRPLGHLNRARKAVYAASAAARHAQE